MAKYQREFLVTYLRDISALQLALHKLQHRLATLKHQKCSLEKSIHRGACPLEPRYEASNGVFAIGLGGYLFLSSFSMFLFRLFSIGCLLMLCGMMALIIGVIRYIKVNQENAQKEKRYNEKLAAYRERQQKNEHNKKKLPGIEDEICKCKREIKRVQEALRSVYRSNVIPEHYQDLYTALFLYIWFEAGKSNNLDMTASLLVDDQLKKKLDLFIVNKSEMILKQYLQFAKQYRTPGLQKKYTAMLEHKLNQSNVSNENCDTYLAMVKSNATTIAYFATADYLEHT